MTPNEHIEDKLIDRALVLERVQAGLVRDAARTLLDTQRELTTLLINKDPTAVQRTTYQQARLEAILREMRGILNASYHKLDVDLQRELRELYTLESQYVVGTVNQAAGAAIAAHKITPELLQSSVKFALVQTGETGAARLSDYWSNQKEDTRKRFEREMRAGVLSGESLGQLIARVKGGTTGGIQRPGFMNVSRRNAETLVRTATLTVTGNARRDMYAANSDIISGIRQISTLDSRTTKICMGYSGAAWTIPDYKPIAPNDLPHNGGTPRHPRCRSGELSILREFSDLPKRKQAKIPQSNRASMDGQIPKDITFDDWLRRKDVNSPGFADEMLGATSAQLFREGRISLRDLLDQKGRPLRVADIRPKPASSTSFAESLKKTEDKLTWKKGNERVVIIDKQGRVVLTKDGGKHSVMLSADDLKNASGAVLTHNHPSASSFSPADILSAMKVNLAEIRAVGNHKGVAYRYSLTPGGSGQWPTPTAALEKQLISKYKRDAKTVARKARMRDDFANIDLTQLWIEDTHLIIEGIARRWGLTYKREVIKK